MIGLDTNILLRFIVQDDAVQYKLVSDFICKLRDDGEIMFITDVVLSEFIWTIRTGYKYRKPDILRVLMSLLDATDFLFESEDEIEPVIHAYRIGRGDFADYLIEAKCKIAGCKALATLDKALLREAGFLRVEN